MNRIALDVKKKTWSVFDPQIGWLAADGSSAKVLASDKKTKFFSDLALAKAAGFSPTGPQATAVAKWDPKPAAAPATK